MMKKIVILRTNTDLFAMLLSLLCLGTNCDLGLGVLGLASDRGWGLRLASCLSTEDAGEAGEERPESEAEPEPWTWTIFPLKVKQTVRRHTGAYLSVLVATKHFSRYKYSSNILQKF